jgi:hypothetical protein
VLVSKWTDWIEASCAVVNVGVVVTLARLNYLYLQAAKRSAKAAESQANAMQESFPALQRSEALDIENENFEMRKSVNSMLTNVQGLKDSIDNLRGIGPSLTLPTQWRPAAHLLRVRRRNLIPEVELVEAKFRQMQLEFFSYSDSISHGAGPKLSDAGWC